MRDEGEILVLPALIFNASSCYWSVFLDQFMFFFCFFSLFPYPSLSPSVFFPPLKEIEERFYNDVDMSYLISCFFPCPCSLSGTLLQTSCTFARGCLVYSSPGAWLWETLVGSWLWWGLLLSYSHYQHRKPFTLSCGSLGTLSWFRWRCDALIVECWESVCFSDRLSD